MRIVRMADETEVEIPDIEYSVDDKEALSFRITEGPHEGVIFSITEMKMDEQDESLLWYDLQVTGASSEDIKHIADAWIIALLEDAIERKADK